MRFFIGTFLILPLLLAADGLRITDSSRSGSSALRKAALEYSLANSCDIRIDRMSAGQNERLLPQNMVDIAIFEEGDVPESLKNSKSLYLGYEALVIYVNTANPVKKMSSGDVRKVFTEQRPRWSEFGGFARAVHRINLKRTAEFSKLDLEIFKTAPASEVAGVESVGDIVKLVGADPDAMGFGYITGYDAKVQVLAVDGVLPTTENCRKKRYPFVRSYRLFIVKPSAEAEKFVSFLKKDIKEQVKLDMWQAE